ncbi:beta-glucuronidase [Gilvimarinus agarilyticus]|uniref:glycoside hydrolase family 2 protein n=1 Tax=Gilvimarinus sp. 2_MG-2023 TaxID=3062666 RepID=UPI001C09D86C|nr:glycoside hydrolase family 2 TIM barrel-domain containing protein [Gilvimarinus sp. 2_MG-2023]MBU2887826.1 beta-glucuronidase [Gilvimarinus agarilyticus]MDO6572464.1 glycoside hydrolase family 2 TIM barrel-domain containing protein [Gilvimarinus sp. 2_MG-2023]
MLFTITRGLILAAIVFCSGAYAAKITQNTNARPHINLDGAWHYIADPYENGFYNHRYQEHTRDGYFKNAQVEQPGDLIEYDFANAATLNVPGDWNTQQDELFLYEGTVWYQRDFTLNKSRNERYILHFGAANYEAVVYVNGQKVGTHIGGFTPFEFDVTDVVNDGDNFVIVKVDNRREREQIPTVNTDWWNYGGLTRSVKLLTLPKQHISDYSIHLADGDSNSITGWVELNQPLNNAKVTVEIPELKVKQTLKFTGDARQNFQFKAEPILWGPSNPKLYDVRFRLHDQTLSDRIGFRQIDTKGEDILLNGKPIFLKGISIHEESALHPGRAWSQADAKQLLSMAKELGVNFVRLAHYPHNEHMVRMADEMGLLVWSEIPVYWTVLFERDDVYANAQNQLSEMISRDKNRASIILWSMANETPMSDARLTFISKLAAKARELDGTRLITAALDTSSETDKGKSIDDPLSAVVDVIGINNYCGWYYKEPAQCAKVRWFSDNNKPVIMSEFGGGALAGYHGAAEQRWSEEYQADLYRYNLQMIDNMSFIRGMTPWILKDFRSPRRPLANIQDFWNRKGLVSDKGVKKQAWHILNQYYEQHQ